MSSLRRLILLKESLEIRKKNKERDHLTFFIEQESDVGGEVDFKPDGLVLCRLAYLLISISIKKKKNLACENGKAVILGGRRCPAAK